ncbi:unnamed protein product [Ceutorhynchus assimilis]|uniref:GMP reductase n=1 Tax=Ceutorhynchus assimilis TaxID=467358 RepID=A0A9P0DDE2_9CUCU|nr:unnamed protein product [Ceutorhynchus assimilis]
MPNIINEIKLDFKDVLLRPKRSTLRSRNDVNLHRHITFRNSKQTYNGIPVMASNMDTVGTFEMAKVLSKHDLFTCVHKYYTADEWKKFAEQNPDVLRNVAASSGMSENDFNRLAEIIKAVPGILFICLDVANGYSQHFVDFVRRVRAAFPSHTIIAGNVVTGEMVEELILSGADIIKVGIGPGSVCTTRMKTGVGYPQLSAVIECADAAHGLQGHIISETSARTSISTIIELCLISVLSSVKVYC